MTYVDQTITVARHKSAYSLSVVFAVFTDIFLMEEAYHSRINWHVPNTVSWVGKPSMGAIAAGVGSETSLIMRKFVSYDCSLLFVKV